MHLTHLTCPAAQPGLVLLKRAHHTYVIGNPILSGGAGVTAFLFPPEAGGTEGLSADMRDCKTQSTMPSTSPATHTLQRVIGRPWGRMADWELRLPRITRGWDHMLPVASPEKDQNLKLEVQFLLDAYR